ncbi:hypothetical protein EYC98_03285 [Halieaceae bacterium IMCC14734]|uniref:Uncharacterized protein n=1 Tax=Candidatus Litorirhabdus singularis TaxID=2518993 RepID=A0ABT3TC65_9GAMM|nr:hypothetical protein [Candidatus Litorirhabdus singularis]MCX2979883.1 hypothetical protein [Candidatus Litorirhabdus singularis]
MTKRQQVLYLWLAEGALDTETIGWAFHDGTDGDGPQLPDEEPPYVSGLAALQDGWFLMQSPSPLALHPGTEHEVSYLVNEFIFERRIDI